MARPDEAIIENLKQRGWALFLWPKEADTPAKVRAGGPAQELFLGQRYALLPLAVDNRLYQEEEEITPTITLASGKTLTWMSLESTVRLSLPQGEFAPLSVSVFLQALSSMPDITLPETRSRAAKT